MNYLIILHKRLLFGGIAMQLFFNVEYDGEWWCASAREPGNLICTQGETIGELINNILDATSLHYHDLLRTGEQITIITTYRSTPSSPIPQATPHFEYRVDLVAATSGY